MGQQDGRSERLDRQQRRQIATQLTQVDVEQLVQVSLRAARAGNQKAARAVLLALTEQRPDELQAWVHLAELAESDEERCDAFQHVLILDPEHQEARQWLEQFQAQESTVEPAVAPLEEDRYDPPSRQGWLYLAAIGFGLFLVALLVLMVFTGDERTTSSNTSATAVLPGQSGMLLPTYPPDAGLLPYPVPHSMLDPTVAGMLAYPVPISTIEPRQSALLVSPATTTPPLPPPPIVPVAITPAPVGMVLEYDGWQATLLRPDYVQLLDGAIGELQPGGRFVLALLSVGNRSDVARAIPPELFLLIDKQGRSYRSLAPASHAYLQLYGPSRGDLTSDASLPSGGSLYSVPLIFDVSPDATGLILTMGQQTSQGWGVLDMPPPPDSNNAGS